MEPRKQFTFYRSYWEALKRLPKKDRLPALDAIIIYAIYGSEPEGLPPAAETAFILIKPTLDAGRKKSDSGKRGGESEKGTPKQSESKAEANIKQTEREKEKEEEKEVEIEIENECYIGAEIISVISLPLNDGSEFPVCQDMISEFSCLYPAVDVMQELRNMRGWLLNNPKNRKTRSGIRRFINSWLSREQDKPKARQQQYTHGADRLADMVRRGDFDDET